MQLPNNEVTGLFFFLSLGLARASVNSHSSFIRPPGCSVNKGSFWVIVWVFKGAKRRVKFWPSFFVPQHPPLLGMNWRTTPIICCRVASGSTTITAKFWAENTRVRGYLAKSSVHKRSSRRSSVLVTVYALYKLPLHLIKQFFRELCDVQSIEWIVEGEQSCYVMPWLFALSNYSKLCCHLSMTIKNCCEASPFLCNVPSGGCHVHVPCQLTFKSLICQQNDLNE